MDLPHPHRGAAAHEGLGLRAYGRVPAHVLAAGHHEGAGQAFAISLSLEQPFSNPTGRHRRSDSQADERGAGEPALKPEEAPIPAEEIARRTGEQSEKSVA